MKVCKIIWSTNRLEYLVPTLKSQNTMLDFSGCQVEGLFIDDMPNGRHDGTMFELAKNFGYTEIVLHQQNMGLPHIWNVTFDFLRQKDYDYVFLSEDDVVFKQPIKIMDLAQILHDNAMFSQVCLTRQKWYDFEQETQALETDIIIDSSHNVSTNYRAELSDQYFWSLASFFPRAIVDIPHRELVGEKNLSEYVVAKSLQSMNMKTCKLKSETGENLVEHIGGYSVGKRAEPGDPRWEDFAAFDPNTKYNSRDGTRWID
jgi:hypothetical protein